MVHVASEEKQSSINRIAIAEPEDAQPRSRGFSPPRRGWAEKSPGYEVERKLPYLFLSREDDDDVTDIGKHDFRSVLLHREVPSYVI